jgi:hypothetical protein
MKTFRFTMALLAISVTAFLGCSKTDLTAPNQSSISSRSSSNTVAGCDPVTFCLIDNKKVQQGTVSVSNDATNVYITINVTGADFKLLKAALIIGNLAHVQAGTNLTGWPVLAAGPLNPDYSVTPPKPGVTSVTFTVPLANLGDCFYFAIYGKLCKKDAYGKTITDYIFLKSATKSSAKCWSTYVQYCKCTPPPPPDCGEHRTVTQGGWGAVPNGNNPGQYLADHFATCFGASGVTIGSPVTVCANGHTLTMNTAQAITDYLPTGSTAAVLTQDWTNTGPDNVLAGQVLTLALNLGFDDCDPTFSSSTVWLGDMIITSGTFVNMKVSDFLAIANAVLGGCSVAYTPAQINEAATAINENFDNGADNGFLDCPAN